MDQITPAVVEWLKNASGVNLVSLYLPPLMSVQSVKRGVRTMADVIKLLQTEYDQQEKGPAQVSKAPEVVYGCHLCISAVQPSTTLYQCPCGKTYHQDCAEALPDVERDLGHRKECPSCQRPVAMMGQLVVPQPTAPAAPKPQESVPITPERATAMSNLKALIDLLANTPRSSIGYCAFSGNGQARVYIPPEATPIDKITYRMGNTYLVDPLISAEPPRDGLDHEGHVCVAPGNPTVCHFEMLLEDMLNPDGPLDQIEVDLRARLVQRVKDMATKVATFEANPNAPRT